MNKTITFFLIVLFSGVVSCNNIKLQKKQNLIVTEEFSEIIKEEYELYKPTKEIKAVLMLFGGYPELAKDIKREFKILELAKKNNIAVVFLNYNKKLWLEGKEKYHLAEKLQEIIEKNHLPKDSIFIGGFSSGGVVSLLISDFIVGMKQFYINPKGVFIVDSPIDLAALYNSSEKNVERNFSEVSVQESNWILKKLGSTFGNPKDDIKKYEDKSVFTFRTNNTSNLQHLKSIKIRLYTEPDTLWWKKHRMADYEQMNAFYIKILSESLTDQGFKNVEYIPTKNKGYRANGDRHPHSWGIINKKELIQWMLKK